MDAWKRVWREGFAPNVSTKGLLALKEALEKDDPRLIQGATTSPPPLRCVQDWPCEAACVIGYCGWEEIEWELNGDPVSIRPEGAMEIPLTKGKVAWVSAEDYPGLSNFSWWALEHHGRWYAYRTECLGGGRANEQKRNIQMHRQIMGEPKGQVVDHRDRNGLNNTRDNLRLTSDPENKRNCKRSGLSKFRGVYPSVTQGKWCAKFSDNDKTVYIGTFNTERDAADAFNRAVLGRFGADATLNKFATVADVEEFFARLCFEADQALGEPAACRWLLNWSDETPRDQMRRELLAEVVGVLAGRAKEAA